MREIDPTRHAALAALAHDPLTVGIPAEPQPETDLHFRNWRWLIDRDGIGWAMLYYDRTDGRLLNAWIDEQHLGQLQDCALILGLDMWEHSFVADYQPSGKKQYVDDFFENLNWKVVEENFKKASK